MKDGGNWNVFLKMELDASDWVSQECDPSFVVRKMIDGETLRRFRDERDNIVDAAILELASEIKAEMRARGYLKKLAIKNGEV